MTAVSRLARVEASLSPREAVLAWLGEAQQFPSLIDYTRSIVDLPDSAAPLSRISAHVDSFVRDAMKGQPSDAVERAARRAVGDAVFLFALIFRINGTALEVARHQGLVAVALFFWMGTLLGDPLADDAEALGVEAEHAGQPFGTWGQWSTVFDGLVAAVQIEGEARETLERRYLWGHRVLFADAAREWADLSDLVEQVSALADLLPSVTRRDQSRRGPGRNARGRLAEQVENRTKTLADDARVTALELLGDRTRAASIMALRLRTEQTTSSSRRKETAHRLASV